jgi:leucyl aminopeptidase
MLANDDDLAERVRTAGEQTAERVWQLPLWDEYREQLKSDIADLKNIGGRAAGTITAGAFLSEFAADYPWVHLDVAGTALPAKTGPYIPKGPGGIGVRLLTELARNWRKKS